MTAYEKLETRARRLYVLGDALGILSWDREVMMPDGAAPGRAMQMATLLKLRHELQTDPAMGELLDAVEAENLDEWQFANVREMRHGYLHATALPGALVEPLEHARSECGHTWSKARGDNDWAAVLPKLEKLVALARDAGKAKADAMGLPLYDALLDEYDPGRRSAQVDQLFGELEAALPPILDAVLARQETQPPVIWPKGPFSTERQMALSKRVMALLQFDFHQGRLDVSSHPFSGGAQGDRRITTRYDEDDFTTSLMGTIHETGHSQYEAGLPQKWAHQPVGDNRGMTIHESQSLLFEMQAGRSREVVSHLAPLIQRELGGEGPAWEPENLIRLYQHVKRGLIRVDADEVTYPLHVMLRYRLERQLMAEEIEVADLPAAWNEMMQNLVGIVPPNHKDGVMQDIHWYEGIFGYFPTYTLGAMTAAQLFATLKKAVPDVMTQLEAGDWSGLIGWLREHVHGQGCRLSSDELIEFASGAALSTAPFLGHLKARYLRDAA